MSLLPFPSTKCLQSALCIPSTFRLCSLLPDAQDFGRVYAAVQAQHAGDAQVRPGAVSEAVRQAALLRHRRRSPPFTLFHLLTRIRSGNISHVHCCRLSYVPPFCWQFCSGNVRDAQRSNRLCIYWMPEILACYDRAYGWSSKLFSMGSPETALRGSKCLQCFCAFVTAPYPGPPEQVLIANLTSTTLEVCWQKPKIRGDTVLYYTIRYQELPRFPFLGGSQYDRPFLPTASH